MQKKIRASFIDALGQNLSASDNYIQVILGPRQVGKTTGILDFLKTFGTANLYFSADDVLNPNGNWIELLWQEALLTDSRCLLVIDEIQKVPDWSSAVKRLWDKQKRFNKSKVRLVLLGSSSLHIHQGLKESLTGRFQMIRAHHWDFRRSKQLGSLDLRQFITQGGYPGSYELLGEVDRWEKYIHHSIIDTVIGKDILQIARIAKPALFRQAFQILMAHPAQDISYSKLLGQIQDRGNTDLIKHYIELFEAAFLLESIQKFSNKALVSRASSPKLVPLCGALIDRQTLETPTGYGRAVEAAVGACLIQNNYKIWYWREGDAEVDYITRFKGKLCAIEVKSGRHRTTRGLERFQKKLNPLAHAIYVSESNLESFLLDPTAFFEKLF